jgi:rhodanese-related sulfurtransferase
MALTTEKGLAEISRAELKSKLDRGDDFVLVETLSPGKYHEAHLPGAINLPTEQVRRQALDVLPDKNAEIVLYCGGFT